MRDATDDERLDRLVAEIVDARRPEILSAYEEWLTAAEGDRSRPAPRWLLERAASVLDDARQRLSTDGADPPRPPRADLRRDPNGGAPGGVDLDGAHPDCRLPDDRLPGRLPGRPPPADPAGRRDTRCLGALMRIAIDLVTEGLPAGRSAAYALAHFAVVLHQSIVEQMVAAADGYADYLIDLLHRSHLDERRRVARDLHDLVAHSIAVALQHLELAAVHRGRDDARAQAKLDLALENLRDTLDLLRAISHDLRQSAASAGLTAALRSYLDTASFPRETDVRVTGDEAAVPPAVQGELFLVLREALRNAHLHGGATIVRLHLDIGADAVRARVRDDGRGFGAGTSPDHAMGTGLASMRERVALLGGVIEVDSAMGEGTSVSVRVPLTKVWDEPED